MRLILDTNIIVSAVIQRNYPYFIVDKLFADKNMELCISDPLFREYVDVLSRDKFSRYPDFHLRARTLLIDIQEIALRFFPTIAINIIKDKTDNRLLELAEASEADFLITGNTNDFTMKSYKQTKIVSAKEMFELFIQ